MSLRKQGANSGATTAFMISTPESGVDSIAISYALLDPIMTVARPAVAFFTAAVAGVAENLFSAGKNEKTPQPDLSCPVDGCCDGEACTPEEHKRHHDFAEKVGAGLRYALIDLWDDLAGWFLIGLLLAGVITSILPAEVFTEYLSGGVPAMLIMLAVGIPIYICATASTPIAAALILKGISPGAALVFLIAGPATNITSLTVLIGVLGKRAAAIYLVAIATLAVLFGLVLDRVYGALGISAQAVVGQASEFVPPWAQWAGAFVLLALSVKPVFRALRARLRHGKPVHRKSFGRADLTAQPPKVPSCTTPG